MFTESHIHSLTHSISYTHSRWYQHAYANENIGMKEIEINEINYHENRLNYGQFDCDSYTTSSFITPFSYHTNVIPFVSVSFAVNCVRNLHVQMLNIHFIRYMYITLCHRYWAHSIRIAQKSRGKNLKLIGSYMFLLSIVRKWWRA